MKELNIHKTAEEELLNVFKSVIENGENNSALVIGPRGSGKTHLIRKCLDKVCTAMNEVLLVNLSGKPNS